VTNSAVPATLKSMSPKASSAPRMSVRVVYLPVGVHEAHRDAGDRRLAAAHRRPSATGSRRRPTPSRSSRWTRAPRTPDGSCRGTPPSAGTTGSRARSASAPWPISRRFGPTHEAGLAGGERREVVVVHVALLGDRRRCRRSSGPSCGHRQGGDVHHLGLATLEQAGAVRGGHDADLGRQGRRSRGHDRRCGPLVDDAAAHGALVSERNAALSCLTARSASSANCRQAGRRPRHAARLSAVRSALSAIVMISEMRWPAATATASYCSGV
jgi:hypothetical protein